MQRQRNPSKGASALQIALSTTLILISVIMLALAAPAHTQKILDQDQRGFELETTSQDTPVGCCVSDPQSGSTNCTPVASLNLPDVTITKPTALVTVNVTVSDIIPCIHGHLQAFQGYFTYDSSVFYFHPSTAFVGDVMTNNGGQWSLSAGANLTNTTSAMKTFRVAAFSTNNVDLDSTGTDNVLFGMNLVRMSNTPGATSPMTWSASPNQFRFFDTDGFERPPSSEPPGSVTIAGPPVTPFSPCNLVVYRVGDGQAGQVTVLNAAPVFLSEYTPSGTFVQDVLMPTVNIGVNRRLTASGSALNEGLLTLSTDGQFLVLPGYNADVGAANPATAASTSVNRVIGRVDAAVNIDTSTALSNAISGANPRGTTSTNSSDLWISGGNATGTISQIRYAMLGATTSTAINTTSSNLRATNIFGGQLYVSAGGTGATVRMATVGAGTPMVASAITTLPGYTTTTTSPEAFFFASLPGGPFGVNTLYVADDNTAGGTGGVQKYSLVGGLWVLNNTIANTTGLRGLTGTVSGGTVTVYVTSSTNLSSLADTSGYNANNNGTLTSIATAGTNRAFRGVAFAPQCGTTSISGTVTYCVGASRPVPYARLNLSGDMTASASTDDTGAYTLSPIPLGGNYTVTPAGLRDLQQVVDPRPDAADPLRVQLHVQSGGTLLTGCAELAAHAAGNATVTIADSLAIQQFLLSAPVPPNNLTGKWRFIPTQRTYMSLSGTQTNQDYDAYILGDVTGRAMFPTPTPPVPPEVIQRREQSGKNAPRELPQVINPKPVAVVSLVEQRGATTHSGELVVAVTVSNIDPAVQGQLQAFQGDLTFDSTVVNFQTPAVQRAGLTSEGNWSLAANVLGTGKIKTLRVSCFSLDGGSLSGSGTLFELRMTGVSNKSEPTTSLVWSQSPNNFIFIDSNLQRHAPLSAPASRIILRSVSGHR